MITKTTTMMILTKKKTTAKKKWKKNEVDAKKRISEEDHGELEQIRNGEEEMTDEEITK